MSRKSRQQNNHPTAETQPPSSPGKQGRSGRSRARNVVGRNRREPVALPRFIVGIGSSAGGLEALRTLLGGLKRTEQMSLVVVQHLAPQHRSRLVEIIGHATSLSVKEVAEGEVPQTNTVYITPPNADVVLEGGVLSLRPPESKVGPKPSVDLFFKSLAEEMGENAVGVILSGTGSDGAQGVRAIHAAGGVTLCQRVESARYDGMPRAAKLTGAVEFELTLEEITRHLARLDELLEPEAGDGPLRPVAPPQEPYQLILSTLDKLTRVNFTHYKPSTIRRRIQRRLVATGCESLAQYAEHLRAKPEEVRLLFQDILISVTSFFRDEASFQLLGRRVAERVRQRPTGAPLRCWVVGCATGEEAYSVAMLLFEALESEGKQLNLQVFATDIDERAMAVARKGLYPKAALAEVPEALRAKYFDEFEQHFRIKDFVRDIIVFARHDVAQDPPFLKLDLITCRNVLIYFTSQLQEHVLKMFHFALDDQGMLFLGKSEATAAAGDLFELAEKNAKLFLRSGKKGDLLRTFSRQELTREATLLSRDREGGSQELLDSVVMGFAPDSVLVDDEYRVRHLYGEANRYLNLPRGQPTHSILKLLPSEVALDLSALLHRAERLHQTVRSEQRHVLLLGREQRTFQLSVVPIAHEGRREYFVCFYPSAELPPHRKEGEDHSHLPPEARIRELERQLAATREHLQTVIEEHETANEELQSLNEELQSSNEELQSSNEELETTNEELQSANEELTTLNQEVNVKSAELLALNQRLHAIQNAIAYPLLIVDSNLRLTDYNPAARYLMRLSEMDRGQHIRGAVSSREFGPALVLLEDSLHKRRDGKLQLRVGERDFEARVQLFHGSRDVLEGAVLSLVDNTEFVRALEESRLNRERLSAILENTPALVTMKDAMGGYLYTNKRFCEVLELAEEDILGRTDEELFGTEVGSPLRDRDFEVLKSRQPLRVEEVVEAGGRRRYFLSSKFPLMDERRTVQSVCTVALDITERVLHEQQLEIFKKVVSSSGAGLAVLASGAEDGELRVNFATGLLADCLQARGLPVEGARLQALLEALLAGGHSPSAAELGEAVRTQPSASFVLSRGEPGDEERWLELRSAAMRFGSAGYLVLSAFDISERIRSQRIIQSQQEELSHFGKLASLGQVAAGISHEINTPLNVISTKTDLLKRLAERERLERDKLLRVTGEIDEMVKNIANVISGLKSITRMESETPSPHDALELVREATRLSGFRLHRAGVQLTLELPAEPVLVHCFPVQVVQILVNLLNNAVEAVMELRERWIRVEAERVEQTVRIRVTDSGKGIDAAVAERIMTPFFTTKRERQGTGLGLSLSRTLAHRQGGNLRLVTEARNTCFELELPIQTT